MSDSYVVCLRRAWGPDDEILCAGDAHSESDDGTWSLLTSDETSTAAAESSTMEGAFKRLEAQQTGWSPSDSECAVSWADSSDDGSLPAASKAESLKELRATVSEVACSLDLILGRGTEELPHIPGGCVHRAVCEDEGNFCVLRTMPLSHFEDRENSGSGNCKATIDQELRRLKGLKHENLIELRGHVFSPTHVHLHLECFGVTSLSDTLAEFGELDGDFLRRIVRGVVEGLHFLHSRSPPVAHGNLRASSIIQDSHGGVKLSDYSVTGGSTSCVTAGCLPWAAPEVVQQRVAGGEGRLAVDIWSLGCTVIELATARKPWCGQAALDCLLSNNDALIPRIPEALPKSCQAFMKACLVRDPLRRPLITDLRFHRFIMSSR